MKREKTSSSNITPTRYGKPKHTGGYEHIVRSTPEIEDVDHIVAAHRIIMINIAHMAASQLPQNPS